MRTPYKFLKHTFFQAADWKWHECKLQSEVEAFAKSCENNSYSVSTHDLKSALDNARSYLSTKKPSENKTERLTYLDEIQTTIDLTNARLQKISNQNIFFAAAQHFQAERDLAADLGVRKVTMF